MRILVYPGSFDPITNGHLDIIRRASKICDKLIVAVLVNSKKKPAFDKDERIALIEKCVKDIDNVNVDAFEGLLVDFVEKHNAKAIIKGLRAVSDYEYELQMAHINKRLSQEMETLFMMASAEYSFLSSSLIKEIAKHGAKLDGLVPDAIIEDVIKKFKE